MFDITAEFLKSNQFDYTLIDVREPHEFVGEMGLIEGALNIPMGEHLLKFFESADPSLKYVFICSAGVRSGIACEIATTYGFRHVFNLKGGMVAWGGA